MAPKSEKILNLPTGIPVPLFKCGSEAVRCKPVSLRAPLISIPKRRLRMGIAAWLWIRSVEPRQETHARPQKNITLFSCRP